jgi:hypothetical protein
VSGVVTDETWIETGNSCARGHTRNGRHELHGGCHESRRHFEHGDDHGWHHGPDGSTDDLVPGASVDDALLLLKDGRAWFAKIDLDD